MGECRAIELACITRPLAHAFYSGFVSDPANCANPNAFRFYRYNPRDVDRYVDRQMQPDRCSLMILLDGRPIGEVQLREIDLQAGMCRLGIHLQRDRYKGRGIGTQALVLALDYAFGTMRLRTVEASALHANARSRRVLEKAGFIFVGEDALFCHYRCERPQQTDAENA